MKEKMKFGREFALAVCVLVAVILKIFRWLGSRLLAATEKKIRVIKEQKSSEEQEREADK